MFQSPTNSVAAYEQATPSSYPQSPEQIVYQQGAYYVSGPPVSQYQPSVSEPQQQQQLEERQYAEPTRPDGQVDGKLDEAHAEANESQQSRMENAMQNLSLGETLTNAAENEASTFRQEGGWRKPLDQIREENASNDASAPSYAEKKSECAYCRNTGEPESVYTSHW